MKKLCIYHGNCSDGFTAAWIVWRALGETNVEFHAGVYQTSPPDVTGRDVIIVDFSYKRPVLLEMAQQARSILILDHHKSAIEDLVDLPLNVTTVFDLNRSGAMITWDYYNPELPPPPLVNYIQDRDLWKFLLANTREIQACVFSYEYTFENWNMLMNMDLNTLVQDGKAIERRYFKDMNELLPIVTRTMMIGGYKVKVANLPYTFSSDAAGKLAIDEPFAACYWDTEKTRIFSLRSRENGVDVSQIASLYGGGGHARASGFAVLHEVAQQMEIHNAVNPS